MASVLAQTADMVRLVPGGGPAICNIAVTNVCNAICDFCNYAHDKNFVEDREWIDVDRLGEALDILHGRGVRYLTYSGGEPLLHPRIAEMVEAAVARGMRPSLVTNGWLLPKKLESLSDAGLKTLYISLDSPSVEAHETNRGLKGVCERIRTANGEARRRGIKTVASMTINRLIEDFSALPAFLEDLGFDTVTFSYPKRAALGTSSLVYSETSGLVDYTADELVGAFEEIRTLKGRFAIQNPAESLAEMIRHLRKEKERFPCFGGFKYFYMDWKFDIYRCDSWIEKMCTVWEFPDTPFVRDGCTACMSDCYRDSSVLLNFPVAVGDAMHQARGGRLGAAARTLMAPSSRRSIGALLEGLPVLSRLARIR